MSLFSIVLIALAAFLLAILYRRYQIKAAGLARVDGLARSVLATEPGQANRQQLADLLKDWDLVSTARLSELKDHLARHPRLDGVDLDDPDARRSTYEALVGISPGKSPEK